MEILECNYSLCYFFPHFEFLQLYWSGYHKKATLTSTQRMRQLGPWSTGDIYFPCRWVQSTSQHFKTSQAVLGDIIHPACSCYVHLMLSVSARGADARVCGQLKDIWGWVPFHVEEFVPKSLGTLCLIGACVC